MSVSIKKVTYKGWRNCCRIANGKVELIVTTDVGPRVIRFGFLGEPNEFKEYHDHLGQRGGKKWRAYGGHRLWHAPESEPRTYYPDNFPVAMERRGNVVRFIQPVEPTTGIQKEIDIKLSPNRARVELLHRLRNTSHWPVELAPWALTAMKSGGTAIIPLPQRGTHPKDLLPGSPIALWLYTHMDDSRWTWGRKYILLRQDPTPAVKPQKLGSLVPDGWAAYASGGHLFVKQFPCVSGRNYADFGCNFETFTDNEMLELETLGPLTALKPGQTVEHLETWHLFRKVPNPMNDRDVDRYVLPNVRASVL